MESPRRATDPKDVEIRKLENLLADLILDASDINDDYSAFKERNNFPMIQRRVRKRGISVSGTCL